MYAIRTWIKKNANKTHITWGAIHGSMLYTTNPQTPKNVAKALLMLTESS